MANSKDVCNSLQVCKVWRECLAQCPGCIDVVLIVGVSNSLRRATEAASWLQRYGELVQHIKVEFCKTVEEKDWDAMAVAERTIAKGFQLAAAQLRPLQITEVYKEGLQTSAFLRRLPAYSLIKLTLEHLRPSSDTIRALARGLGHLGGLQDLGLYNVPGSPDAAGVFPAACLSGLKQLTNLIWLNLGGTGQPWGSGLEQYLPAELIGFTADNLQAVTGDLQHLTCLAYMRLEAEQLSLTQLPVQLEHLSATTEKECTVLLSQLTSLAFLSIEAPEGLTAGSSLPKKVPVLELDHTPLPPTVCGQLRTLSSLQKLTLYYDTLVSAAAAAPVWGDLPALQTLTLVPDLDGGISNEESECLAIIVGKLPSAKSLQKLHIDVCGSDLPCGIHIANLSQLQSLRLVESRAGTEDLLQLTKLSQLTGLALESVAHMDDALCASLVCNLTQLQSFQCMDGSLGVVSLVVIAHQLKSLDYLELEFKYAVTDKSLPYLMQLTQLAQLTAFYYAPNALSQGVYDQLKGALPKCRIIHSM
jgi:hypothetical protein